MDRLLKRLSIIAIPAVLLVASAWQWHDRAATPAQQADPEIGAPAPDFTLPGSDGEAYTLADLEGSSHGMVDLFGLGLPGPEPEADRRRRQLLALPPFGAYALLAACEPGDLASRPAPEATARPQRCSCTPP